MSVVTADPVALEADAVTAIAPAFELAGVPRRAEQGRVVAGIPPGAGEGGGGEGNFSIRYAQYLLRRRTKIPSKSARIIKHIENRDSLQDVELFVKQIGVTLFYI